MISENFKTCNRCGNNKFTWFFRKSGAQKGNLCSNCLTCKNKWSKEARQKNPKKYRDKTNDYRKKSLRFKKYRTENFKKIAEYNHNWYIENKKVLWEKEKLNRKNNPNRQISLKFRNRLRQALKSQKAKKYTQGLDLLGCSFDFLKQYLESKFLTGMSWKNHGKWHIDHIKSCCTFDLTNLKEQKICFHYTNLQPLWKTDNLKKKKR